MSRPTISEPLHYIVNQLKNDIDRAANKCSDIGRKYRATSTDIQIQRLVDALRSGASFVRDKSMDMPDVKNEDDSEVAEATLREALVGFSRRMNEMMRKLDRYIYPFNEHHDAMHQQHSHHEHPHLFNFFYPCHQHRPRRHSHGSRSSSHHGHHHIDALLASQYSEWLSIRDGIMQAFEHYRSTVAEKQKERKRKVEKEQKWEQKKNEAVKKVEERDKERLEIEKQRADKAAAKLKEVDEEIKATRKAHQARTDRLEDGVYGLATQALMGAGHTIDEANFGTRHRSHSRHRSRSRSRSRSHRRRGILWDDIEHLDHITRLLGHLDLAVNRHHRPGVLTSPQCCSNSASATIVAPNLAQTWNEPLMASQPPVAQTLPATQPAYSSYCSDCWQRRGIMVQHNNAHHHHQRLSSYVPVLGDGQLHEEDHHAAHPAVVIQNNVRGAEVDLEERNSVSGSPHPHHSHHGGHGNAQHLLCHRGRSSSADDVESVDTITISDGRGHRIHAGRHIEGGNHHDGATWFRHHGRQEPGYAYCNTRRHPWFFDGYYS